MSVKMTNTILSDDSGCSKLQPLALASDITANPIKAPTIACVPETGILMKVANDCQQAEPIIAENKDRQNGSVCFEDKATREWSVDPWLIACQPLKQFGHL